MNETWTDGCHSFQCVWSNADTGFAAVVNATNVCKSYNVDFVDHINTLAHSSKRSPSIFFVSSPEPKAQR